MFLGRANFCAVDPACGPIEWSEPPPPPWGLPELGNDVHLWRIDLAVPGSLEELSQTLSAEEHARAERFHFELHRRRYVIGRATLRAILAKYLDRSPRAVAIAYGRWGKPRLACASAGDLEFNVSHSEDVGLVALRRGGGGGGGVGIDVECLDRTVDHLALAAQHFSAQEADAVASAPPASRAETFLRLWTRREAVLKTTGIGLAAAPAFDFAELARYCTVRDFSPAAGFVAALSVTVREPPR
jgi:4'-phosphopantetheinyl transferase